MRRRRKLEVELHLLSAYDAALAAREAAAYGQDGELAAVMDAACLLAKAMYRNGAPMFPDGLTAAKALPAQALLCWARAYDTLSRAEDFSRWQKEKQRLSQNSKERLRWKVLRSFGVLPWESRAKAMTDGDLLYCILHTVLDHEDALDRLCPQCRSDLLKDGCPACGALHYGQNPNFDPSRFEELKHHGASETLLP